MTHSLIRTASLVLLIQLTFSFAAAQAPSKVPGMASVKFKLTDFKNPNIFLTRPGLIRFSSDNKLLAVSGESTDVVVYDVSTGQIYSKIDGKGFNAFSILPDNATAVARGKDYRLSVFDLKTGALLRKLKGTSEATEAVPEYAAGGAGGLEMLPVDFSPDYKKVLTVGGTRNFRLVDFLTGEKLYDFVNPDKTRGGFMLMKAFFGLDRSFLVGLLTARAGGNFTPDGKLALVSNMSRTATLWSLESGKMVTQIGPLDNTILNAWFNPDGKLLATTDSEGVTMIWSVPEGKLVSTIGNKDDSNYFAGWSPHGDKLWTIAFKEDARAYDPYTGKLVMTLTNSNAWSFSYGPDGRYILTRAGANKSSIGTVWDSEKGTVAGTIPKIKGEEVPYRILFDPTGKYVVSASRKDVKIWTIRGELVQSLENAVYPLQFSSDGKFLATGGKNDTGYVWQIGEN